MIDYDYINKLSEKEKAFLNDFTEEYTNASLDSKNLENNMHNTVALKRDCYKRNNDRNADIYTKSKAQGILLQLDDLKIFNENEEDQMIERIILRKSVNNTDDDGNK